MKTWHIIKESALVTTMSLILFYLLTLAPVKKKYYKVMPGGVDFEVYDLIFTGSMKPGIINDTNIVLVELGDTRGEIADQLNILNKYHPKVIAVDAIFSSEGEPLENLKMEMAMEQNDRIVMGSLLVDTPALHVEKGVFSAAAKDKVGYININADKMTSVVRSYYPFARINDSMQRSFTSEIVRLYDDQAYQKLRQRKNEIEMVNYSANLENYFNISKEQLPDYDSTGQLDKLKDKIILMGFFKNQPPLVLEDLHFTPMNPVFSGKSFPDMYGIVIHANILSMILSDQYINMASKNMSYVYAFIITFLFSLFIIEAHYGDNNPRLKKLGLIQYIIIVLVGYIFIQLFHYTRYKVYLEPIVVSMVISIVFLSYYKSLANFLHKKFKYRTIFAEKPKT